MLVGALFLPDGTPVRGRSRRSPVPGGPPPDLGLHLDDLRRPRPRGYAAPWALLRVDWPDFRTPRDPEAAREALLHGYALARDGGLLKVTCTGGRGRTGTALAALAVLAGHPAETAVSWVRAAYHPHAVETPAQRRWVRAFAPLS